MFHSQAGVSMRVILFVRYLRLGAADKPVLTLYLRARLQYMEKSKRKERSDVGALLTLITGRTREQAIGMHKGKGSSEYRRATSLVQMNPDDMERLEICLLYTSPSPRDR